MIAVDIACSLLKQLTTRLLISGSKVRALVRPPSKSMTYSKSHFGARSSRDCADPMRTREDSANGPPHAGLECENAIGGAPHS
jgi:hypothetical protein